LTAGYQLGLALAPAEPIERRQQQRDAERDIVLARLDDLRSELIAIADRIALQMDADEGSVTAPRLILALRAAGFGEMLDAVDPRWIAAVLLPSRGWRCIGESREGSRSRPVKIWTREPAEATRVRDLEKALGRAQAAWTRASEKRSRLADGGSAARVMSANARCMRAAEHRDRVAAQLEEARAADGSNA
jgi:hypothetical protein